MGLIRVFVGLVAGVVASYQPKVWQRNKEIYNLVFFELDFELI